MDNSLGRPCKSKRPRDVCVVPLLHLSQDPVETIDGSNVHQFLLHPLALELFLALLVVAQRPQNGNDFGRTVLMAVQWFWNAGARW